MAIDTTSGSSDIGALLGVFRSSLNRNYSLAEPGVSYGEAQHASGQVAFRRFERILPVR